MTQPILIMFIFINLYCYLFYIILNNTTIFCLGLASWSQDFFGLSFISYNCTVLQNMLSVEIDLEDMMAWLPPRLFEALLQEPTIFTCEANNSYIFSENLYFFSTFAILILAARSQNFSHGGHLSIITILYFEQTTFPL